MLRAKTYENVTMVAKKKNYSCHFCTFLTPVFATLKHHIRDHHLEVTTGRRGLSGGGQRRRRSQSIESHTILLNVSAAQERPARARSDESLLATPTMKSRPSASTARYGRLCKQNIKGEWQGSIFYIENDISFLLLNINCFPLLK